MRQFIKCVTLVALVATSLTAVSPPDPVEILEPKQEASTEKDVVVAAPVPEPAAAVAPAPQTPVYPAGCANYQPIVAQYDWDLRMAMAIMQAENRACDPAIDNKGLNTDGTYDTGLFQVNSIHADMVGGDLESLRNPEINVRVAYGIYAGAGHAWTPWSTYNNGKYLEHLQ